MSFGDGFRLSIKGHHCVYCGEVANTEEHFPPKSYTMHGYKLPACSECNSLAGTAHPTNFEARSDYVKGKLRSKYSKHLSVPDWSDDEIEELNYNLREGVKVWKKQKQIIKDRLAWSVQSYLASIDQSSDFVQIYVGTDFLEMVKKNYSKELKKLSSAAKLR